MNLHYLLLALILLTGIIYSVRKNKLTVPAALTGGVIGLFVFVGASFTGIAEVAGFFLTGSLATSWQMKGKRAEGLAEDNYGKRKAGQVFANAGIAAIAGLLAWLQPANALFFQVLMAASIAAAAGDTLSSELGNIYGRKYINILTFRRDERGLNGVVSLEGTMAGIGGSLLIALIFSVGFARYDYLLLILFAGFIGNLTDSLLGATIERRHLLGNDAINFLNTLTGALVAGGLYHLMR